LDGFGSERIEEFHEPSTNGDFPTRDWFPPEFSWATEVPTACNWDNWDLQPLLDLPVPNVPSTGYWIILFVSPEVMRTSSTSTPVPASSPWPMQGQKTQKTQKTQIRTRGPGSVSSSETGLRNSFLKRCPKR